MRKKKRKKRSNENLLML